jgi:ABC-type spermidine/putrescine transport system permease subunit I
VVAQVFYCFPHALIIAVTALGLADARLYEVADALGTKKSRIFRTVTLPGAKFGLINAAFVVFTLVVTDFGIAKVIGGQFNVLATDAYKQVVGQQNFEMGAVVGMILLIPAVLAFAIDRIVQRRQVALLSARAVPLEPKENRARDLALLCYCALVVAILIGVLGTSVWASFITYWPYNLSLTLKNYDFSTFDQSGWASYWQFRRDGGGRGGDRHRDRVLRRISGREDQADARRAGHRASACDAADGGARPRARPRLCVLHQCELEPAQYPLRHLARADRQLAWRISTPSRTSRRSLRSSRSIRNSSRSLPR